jgi:threonine 3-dehydrogenase
LFAVNAAKAMGAKFVIAIDWDNQLRMDLAKKLGADLVLGKDDNVIDSILAHTGGKGVDNSCEFSGSPTALSNAIHSTRMGGYVNILSVYGNSLTEVPMNDIVFRYLHVKGINGRKMWTTWDKMHELLSTNKIDINTLVTHRINYQEYPEGIELALTGDCGKIVMDF